MSIDIKEITELVLNYPIPNIRREDAGYGAWAKGSERGVDHAWRTIIEKPAPLMFHFQLTDWTDLSYERYIPMVQVKMEQRLKDVLVERPELKGHLDFQWSVTMLPIKPGTPNLDLTISIWWVLR